MSVSSSEAEGFSVLAACYDEPDQELAGRLENLCTADNPPEGILYDPLLELKNRFEATALSEIRLDHARLFLGPFELAAPPFGSVYLDKERNLMGESTQDAVEIYREAGLDMADSFKNPPDHIVAELEFLAYLCSARAMADPETAEKLDELKHRFLTRHLNAWIEPFTRKVEQKARTGFYQLLAELTRKAVENRKNLSFLF